MSDDERNYRARQDPRRDSGFVPPSTRAPVPSAREGVPSSARQADARPPPPSSRAGDAARGGDATRATERAGLGTGERQGLPRGEELAALYRKVADLQAELAENEQRLERALADSAGADEMVGQMLARIGDLEARLHAADKDVAEAQARIADLIAQAGRAKSGQAEHFERMHAAQERLAVEKQETERLRADLERTREEAEAQKRLAAADSIAADQARAEAARVRDETEALRDQLDRERQERETLRLRVVELAMVCEERDAALARAELLDTELETALRNRAAAHEHAAEAALRESETLGRLEELRRELRGAAERELALAERDAEIDALRHERDSLAGRLDAALHDRAPEQAAPSGEALHAAIEAASHALADLQARDAESARARAASLAELREMLDKAAARDDLESTSPGSSVASFRAAPEPPAPVRMPTLVPQGDDADHAPEVEVAPLDRAAIEDLPSFDSAAEVPSAEASPAAAPLAPSHDLPRVQDEDSSEDEPTQVFAALWKELSLDSDQRTIDSERATKS